MNKVTLPTFPIKTKPFKKVMLNTIEEFEKALKKCADNNLCSFDFETGPNSIAKERYDEKAEQILNRYKELVRDKEVHEKMADTASNIKAAERVFKNRSKELEDKLKDLNKWYNAVPFDPYYGEVCFLSFCHDTATGYGIYVTEENYKKIFDLFDKYILSNELVAKVAFNVEFESMYCLRYEKYMLGLIIDPLVMAVRCMQVVAPEMIVDQKRPSSGHGLKNQARTFLGVEMTNFEDLLASKEAKFFNDIPTNDKDATDYAIEDSIYSLYLAEYWSDVARAISIDTESSPFDTYFDWLLSIEMPFMAVIGQMRFHGMTWDEEKGNETYLFALKEQERATKSIVDTCNRVCDKMIEAGIPEDVVNFYRDIDPGKTGKTKAVRTFLFDVLNVPKAAVSKTTGEPSMDKESMLDIVFMVEHNLRDLKEEEYLGLELPDEINKMTPYQLKAYDVLNRPSMLFKEDVLELLNHISDVQKFGTLISSHIEGRKRYVNNFTKRIHCSYTPWTETSRTNSSRPNGQNVPRPDNDPFGIRSLYRAAEGKVLVLIDYAGFELRLMAWQSGDENMLNILNNDGDLHTATACVMTGKEPEDITKQERFLAKAGNFGINYGGTEHSLRSTLKKMEIRKSLNDCAKIVKAINTAYPKISEYQRNIARLASINGYVETIFGYKRLLTNINHRRRDLRSSDERRAANTPIQGSAADIVKYAQIMIYRYIAKNNLHKFVNQIAQVHDEIILEVDAKKHIVQDVINNCLQIMEKDAIANANNFTVKLKADVSIAEKGWGDKIDYKDWITKNGEKQN